MFERFYSIGREERRSVVSLFFYGFGNAAAYVVARTVADSAFLSHIGPERLPEVYMLSAGVVALSSLVYGHLVRSFRVRRIVLLTLFLLAASTSAMPAIMGYFPESVTVFAIVYLLTQVRGSLGTIQFSTLLHEQFGDSNPERVVGILGAGATLAGFTMGMAIGLVADNVDVEGLMYLAAGIDVATMIPILGLRKFNLTSSRENLASQNLLRDSADVTSKFRLRDALRTPYVLSIACVVTMSVLAATLVEYQWKVTAANELQRHEDELAQYFGYFYGSVYLLTGLLQLFVTGRVLQTRGVLVGLLAFPCALLFATCTAWIVSAERLLLWPMTLSKGCDTLKRSMHDPTIQVTYSPLDSGLRGQAITFVTGIAKPFAEAAAAIVLVTMTRWASVQQLSPLIIALILIWLAFNVGVWKRFTMLRRNHETSR